MEKIILLGKSDGAISMISNVISNNNITHNLQIINNLDSEIVHPFIHEGINYTISTDFKHENNEDKFFLGVFYPSSKEKIFDFFKISVENFVNLQHNLSSISPTSKLGHGCFINSFVSIDAYCKIGNFVTINRNSSIGHHTLLSDFVTINPGSHIAGHVKIGKGTTIGMGSTIINGITIGENTFIGAGSVVTKDIPSNVVAYGNPCKIIRNNEA